MRIRRDDCHSRESGNPQNSSGSISGGFNKISPFRSLRSLQPAPSMAEGSK